MNAASTIPAPARSGFPFKRFAVGALYVTVFNIGCAIITFVLGRGTFLENLLASLCIGSVAYVVINGVRLALWPDKLKQQPRWWQIAALILVAVPAAQYGGAILWSLVHGTELPSIQMLASQRILNASVFTLFAASTCAVLIIIRDRLIQAKALAAHETARAESIERQALQAQLQLLQAQIEPHMLFNTLANLQGLIDIDPARAQQMLDQLIQYLRATLTSSRAHVTTLAQEFSLMEAYLGLMSVRMGQRLAYSLALPVDLRNVQLPPMLLQPLIENAIQHGLEPKVDGGHITVSAQQQDGALMLRVLDTGLGLDAPSSKAGTHVGLANTRARLHALFGDAASLTLENANPSGASACLTLPITPP
jgi:hypothetical protein